MCKTLHVIVDADNTAEPDGPAKGSKASKPVKESTPVPGIIEILPLHVQISFN